MTRYPTFYRHSLPDGSERYEIDGSWHRRYYFSPRYLDNTTEEGERFFHRHFVIIGYNWLTDSYIAMRRSFPGWPLVWFWDNHLSPPYDYCFLGTMRFLRRRGLAWWPKGTRVRWRDIKTPRRARGLGKNDPYPHR